MTSKTLDEVTGLNVPNTDYAIPTTSSDEPPVMRDRDTPQCGIFTPCRLSFKNPMAVGVQIPNSCRAIVGTGDNEFTILRVVKRVNPALMALKGCVSQLVPDIPDLVLMCIECQLLQKHLQCDEVQHVCHGEP